MESVEPLPVELTICLPADATKADHVAFAQCDIFEKKGSSFVQVPHMRMARHDEQPQAHLRALPPPKEQMASTCASHEKSCSKSILSSTRR